MLIPHRHDCIRDEVSLELLGSLVPYLQPETTVSSLLLKSEDLPVGWKAHHLLRRETKIFISPVVGTITALQKRSHWNPQDL